MFAKGAEPHKVYTDVYDAADEKFGGQTHLLDDWVFNKVDIFLRDKETINQIKREDKIVLFLHLLGLDTSGHVHKPNSKLFEQNLQFVDRGIEKIVEKIEQAFGHDGRTAYVFTADHGMTDRGSHGSGQVHETETPILAWGAGINYWKNLKLETMPK